MEINDDATRLPSSAASKLSNALPADFGHPSSMAPAAQQRGFRVREEGRAEGEGRQRRTSSRSLEERPRPHHLASLPQQACPNELALAGANSPQRARQGKLAAASSPERARRSELTQANLPEQARRNEFAGASSPERASWSKLARAGQLVRASSPG